MPIIKQDKPSKTVQSIRMLKILKSKQYTKKEELASLLGETTTRNINNYKNALYDAGYYIDYQPGKEGGYYLVHDHIIPSATIQKEQIDALSQIYDYVLEDKNFVNRQLFLDFLSNILGNSDSSNKPINKFLFGHFPLSMKDNDIQNRYYLLQTAIDSGRKVKINYKGYYSDNIHIIHPIRLFKFQNWHIYAIDTRETRVGKNRYTAFKLHRIIDIELLPDHFEKDKEYEDSEHFSDRGLVTDQPINVKLLIYGSIGRTMDEKIYGENQKVELVNKNRMNYTFEARMYDPMVVLKFVLSLGSNCKVIEPLWLKKAVVENSKRIIEFYKRDDL